MNDKEIEERLGIIISDMAQINDARKEYLRALLDKRRCAAVYVASGNLAKLTNPIVLAALKEIVPSKRTVEMVANLTELEIGEMAFKESVNVEILKLYDKEIDALKNLIVHISSQRKAERL